jgi:16S rRNA (uracil1498-N3)-methyltransferase
VKLHDKTESKMERWKKIVIESSKQCGRGTLMDISEPISFASLLESGDAEKLLVFSERGGGKVDGFGVGGKITALVGPEGGWSDAELESAKDAEVRIVTLGGRILRAETAAVSVATILQHRAGDLN